jgi:phosphofructokinase-like protein
MSEAKASMRVAILTGGGDVPGLNAAIRAVARRSFDHGWEVYGIYDGWRGLRDGIIGPLERADISGILHRGGTILGSSRTNLAGSSDDMDQALSIAAEFGLDAVIAIGGADTLTVCTALASKGLPTIGIPKTMDNDIPGTDYCIGFNTAVTTVADALDKLHTTAEAHHRVIVVEVMGRYTGWVAVMGGLAGGADYIAIPEQPCSLADICTHLHRRWEMGKKFSIVVVAEGAKIAEVQAMNHEAESEKDSFGHIRLDLRGLAPVVSRAIQQRTGFETRFVVLGHVQRGGSPTVYDRVLATRMGVRAADLIKQGKFARMVALHGDQVIDLPLQELSHRRRKVNSEFYELARLFY